MGENRTLEQTPRFQNNSIGCGIPPYDGCYLSRQDDVHVIKTRGSLHSSLSGMAYVGMWNPAVNFRFWYNNTNFMDKSVGAAFLEFNFYKINISVQMNSDRVI